MALLECCDRCKTGRREVKKYLLEIKVDKEMSDGMPEWVSCGERHFVLCDEHLEDLTAGIDRAISPPTKRTKP